MELQGVKKLTQRANSVLFHSTSLIRGYFTPQIGICKFLLRQSIYVLYEIVLPG